jgi:hypothetical protein
MTDWGRKMFVTPGVVVDGKLVTTDLVDINLGIRILLGSSYYDDWEDQPRRSSRRIRWATRSTAHPWNQTHHPAPQKRDFDDKYSWVMSPRWFDKHRHLALDTGGGPIARLWSTALAGWSTSATSRPPAQREDQPAEDGDESPRSSSSGRSRSGATPSSATARAPTSRPTRPRALHFARRR